MFKLVVLLTLATASSPHKTEETTKKQGLSEDDAMVIRGQKSMSKMLEGTGDGLLSLSSFREILKATDKRITNDLLDYLIGKFDMDKSDNIDSDEFKRYTEWSVNLDST